jgi:hypothetical protein
MAEADGKNRELQGSGNMKSGVLLRRVPRPHLRIVIADISPSDEKGKFSLVEVSFHNGHQFLGGLHLRRLDFAGWREEMIPDVSFNQPRHETVQSAAARGYQLKNIFAAAVALERPFDRLDLPFDAADPPKLSLNISGCVRQRLLSLAIRFTSSRLHQLLRLVPIRKIGGAGRTRTGA